MALTEEERDKLSQYGYPSGMAMPTMGDMSDPASMMNFSMDYVNNPPKMYTLDKIIEKVEAGEIDPQAYQIKNDEHLALLKKYLEELMEPVEGVDVHLYAEIVKKMGSAGNDESKIAGVLEEYKIEKPTWDTINKTYIDKMAGDPTNTLTGIYGEAFTGVTMGNRDSESLNTPGGMSFGGAEAPEGNPKSASGVEIPFEKYLEIQSEMGVISSKGIDANAFLAEHGLTAVDWSKIGAHWNAHLLKDPELLQKQTDLMPELDKKFEEKYAGTESSGLADDIEF